MYFYFYLSTFCFKYCCTSLHLKSYPLLIQGRKKNTFRKLGYCWRGENKRAKNMTQTQLKVKARRPRILMKQMMAS